MSKGIAVLLLYCTSASFSAVAPSLQPPLFPALSTTHLPTVTVPLTSVVLAAVLVSPQFRTLNRLFCLPAFELECMSDLQVYLHLSHPLLYCLHPANNF